VEYGRGYYAEITGPSKDDAANNPAFGAALGR